MIYWVAIIAVIFGYVIGRNRETKDEGYYEDELRRLHDDIAYYKKLTKNLVEENTEFRKKINES